MGIDLNQDLQAHINRLIAEPYFWYVIVGLFVFICIVKQLRTRSDIRLFDNEGGVVTVSRAALLSLIRKTCMKACSNSSPKIKVYFKRRKLNVHIKLKVPSSQNIQALSIYLQSQIQTVITENLNFNKIGSIDILLSGFTVDKTTKQSQERAKASDL